MTRIPTAHTIRRAGEWSGPASRCRLTYEDRFLRRKVLTDEAGNSFLVDLAQTTDLRQGDAFALEDGRLVEVIAAAEDLLEVRGDLPRLAWHIGNRHTPAQIEPARILIQRDHVIRDMLARLGASLADMHEPFTPEGGAYGIGRTHGHSHEHGHGHGPGHDHDPDDRAAPETAPVGEANAQLHDHTQHHAEAHSHAHSHAHAHDHSHASARGVRAETRSESNGHRTTHSHSISRTHRDDR